MMWTDILLAFILLFFGFTVIAVIVIAIFEWRLLCQRLREMREQRKLRGVHKRKKAKRRASEREIELYLSRQKRYNLLSEMDQASELIWRRDLLQPEARP